MKSLHSKITVALLLLSFAFLMNSCGASGSKIRTTNNSESSKKGKLYKSKGVASYYHDKFNGRKTASGARFDNSGYTAAHRELAFGTKVRVTNLVNNKSVVVTINDRGPFSKGREIDLTKKAFMEISDKTTHGELSVKIELLH
ncbi:rare lipoprotein A [Flavobacterium saliperosum S13]|uniref:Probable endolytic peptidoglycan transglycosylase RlpA n=2 Tax=Flavobacterium saliperosum TaxID=329186 RepID=A0A1G4W2W6_9FLAO|nr:septal ring lytic transglycosylase RlpA family protein [Flavobacterium saliperosum]ESU27587.1 rare lipoprotein A [Flavobacterium saliperosum S13]SCX15400.1 rare lipoprotein A [Flavobacterium saliperosum]